MSLFDKNITEQFPVTSAVIMEKIKNHRKTPILTHPGKKDLDNVIEKILESIYYSIEVSDKNTMTWSFPLTLFGVVPRKKLSTPISEDVLDENYAIMQYVTRKFKQYGFDCVKSYMISYEYITIRIPTDDLNLKIS